MLRETGRVVAVEPGAVWVETVRSSTCGRCAVRAGCGHGALAGALELGRGMILARESHRLQASDCRPGDAVEIELPESAVTVASLVVYGWPLASAVLAALVLGRWGEISAVMAFMAGLLGGFLLARPMAQRVGSRGGFEPRLVARVARDEELIASSVVG